MDELLNDPTLVDPDGEEESKYSWDEDFQRHVLALLVADRIFLLQSLDLIRPSYFTSRAHQKICGIVFTFFKKYHVLPRKDFIAQEIKSDPSLKENKSLPYFLAELNVVCDYFRPGLEARDYLQDKITYFAKIQAVKQAFQDSLKEIAKDPESEGTWEKVYDKMRNAMTIHQNFEVGIDYFNSIRERYLEKAVEDEEQDRFITGLHENVDKLITGGGYIRGEIISVVAGSGVGKCHGKGTPILMYDGTIKMVQDIVVGDLVMGDDSTPRRVLNTHSGFDEMYDIIPVKGDKYTVSSRHTLVFKSSGKSIAKENRCVNPRYWKSRYHVGGGVFEIEVGDFLNQSLRFRNTMKGYRTQVDFPSRTVRINPYVLGVWLGDGTERTTDFTVSHPAVVEELQLEASNRGLKLNPKEDRGEATTYSITAGYNEGHGVGSNSLRNDFKHYDLFENKHIPNEYKVNDRNTRLQLLAGLIDTDGSKSNNCFDFVNKNKQLAEDVVFVARSLGFAAYMSSCEKSSQNGAVGQYWRVTISGDLSCVPVRIHYKECAPRNQIKDQLVTGIKIVPVGMGEYFGFETDGNHRFLLGDFTVVHNSVMLACVTASNLLRGKRGVYISLELAERKVADRFDAILTGLPVQRLIEHKDEIYDKLSTMKGVWRPDKGMGALIIKEFPSGTASVNTVRAYLSQLRFRGYEPDFVIVDYIGEMADIPDIPLHQSREKLVRQLRAMASEEKVFVAVAMQPNRDYKKEKSGSDHGRIDDAHLADSYGQIRPLDGCFSLNQNDTEKKLGIGRCYVIKQRDGKSRYQFHLRFDPENLRITEISDMTYKQAMNTYKEKTEEEVIVDRVGWKPSEEKSAEQNAWEENVTQAEEEVD